MINIENIFQNGKEMKYGKNSKLFTRDEAIGNEAIFFIKKGLVKLQIPRKEVHEIKLYLREGDFIGVPEVYAHTNRLTTAICESEIECYVWTKDNFLMTASMIWELSLYTIKSLSMFLKIINAEFIEKESIEL